MLTDARIRELLTVKEAAQRLRLHPITVRRMIDDSRLPAAQLGGPGTAIRVNGTELDRLLDPKETE
ncbi:MAG TPA: helix-turn-helix domain-containing protein [Gaiellaceae bacterium]|nr:helix-turn-helix domain-containing protein [Gaiellaceae bacterium]